MEVALVGVIAFAAGFILGGVAMLTTWENSAKRGGFEIGKKLYRCEAIDPQRTVT